MTWPTEADYSWVDRWEALGYCVALVANRYPAEALRLIVSHPVTGLLKAEKVREWVDNQTYADYGTSVEATNVDGWTVIVELNGYQATIPAVAMRLSRGTRAVTMFRNVNALMSFQWAVDGVIVRQFDPLLYTNLPRVGQPLPEESGLPFGVGHPESSAFACAERLTSVHLTQELLDHRAGWLAVGHYPRISSESED